MTIDNWINLFVAIGTILLAILVVYGDSIKSYLVGPKLSIKIRDLNKEQIVINKQNNEFLYSHLIIENNRPNSIARNVEVLVTNVRTKTGAQIDYQNRYWPGSIPLFWQYSLIDKSYNDGYISIGPTRICDLLSISKINSILHVSTRVVTNTTRIDLSEKGSIELEITLAAENFKSKPYYFEIIWDGKWIDKIENIKSHLKINEIKKRLLIE